MEAITWIAHKFPSLNINLRKANLPYSAEEFIKRTLISALYMSLGILLILFFLTARSKFLVYSFLAYPFIFFILFLYFLQIPIVKIGRISKEINKEIIFAGRFLIVELESGVTLYDAMKNVSKSYQYSGAYFREIVNKINIGTSLEIAISETIDVCPSESLIKILWQISNSLNTGSDLVKPLRNVVETLVKEQQILVNEYAKKLNPLAMFYMMIAVIMPSLGVTLFTIIAIFAGLKLNLTVLLTIAFLNGFVQFMFIAMINSIRPPVEL